VALAVPTPFSLFINPSCVIGGFLTSFLPFWLSLQSPFIHTSCWHTSFVHRNEARAIYVIARIIAPLIPTLGQAIRKRIWTTAFHYDVVRSAAGDLIPVVLHLNITPLPSPTAELFFAPVPVSTPRDQRSLLFD
jgi:hypothetical protein